MATVYVTMQQAGVRGAVGNQPVAAGPFRSETITSSGTSAAGVLASRAGEVASVFCATAVYVNSGAAASPTAGKYIPASTMVEVGLQRGHVLHVIDAA